MIRHTSYTFLFCVYIGSNRQEPWVKPVRTRWRECNRKPVSTTRSLHGPSLDPHPVPKAYTEPSLLVNLKRMRYPSCGNAYLSCSIARSEPRHLQALSFMSWPTQAHSMRPCFLFFVRDLISQRSLPLDNDKGWDENIQPEVRRGGTPALSWLSGPISVVYYIPLVSLKAHCERSNGCKSIKCRTSLLFFWLVSPVCGK